MPNANAQHPAPPPPALRFQKSTSRAAAPGSACLASWREVLRDDGSVVAGRRNSQLTRVDVAEISHRDSIIIIRGPDIGESPAQSVPLASEHDHGDSPM